MEEDIDYLKRHIKAIGKTRSTEAIENLINKYKEQEEQIEEYKLNAKEAMHEAQENARIFRKEQAKTNEYRKMIELMLIDLSDGAFYMDDNAQNCEVKHKECDGKENVPCRKCLLEYYEKKAKGE